MFTNLIVILVYNDLSGKFSSLRIVHIFLYKTPWSVLLLSDQKLAVSVLQRCAHTPAVALRPILCHGSHHICGRYHHICDGYHDTSDGKTLSIMYWTLCTNVTLSRNVTLDPKCHTSLPKCHRLSAPKRSPIRNVRRPASGVCLAGLFPDINIFPISLLK